MDEKKKDTQKKQSRAANTKVKQGLVEGVEEKPPDQKGEFIEESFEIQEYYEGFTPHPNILQGFENIHPGLALRIFDQVEKEQIHRHEINHSHIRLNEKALSHIIIQGYLGQIFGFIVGMTGLIGAFILLYHDKQLAGLATLITALGILIGVFIYGKKSESQQSKTESEDRKTAEDQS